MVKCFELYRELVLDTKIVDREASLNTKLSVELLDIAGSDEFYKWMSQPWVGHHGCETQENVDAAVAADRYECWPPN